MSFFLAVRKKLFWKLPRKNIWPSQLVACNYQGFFSTPKYSLHLSIKVLYILNSGLLPTSDNFVNLREMILYTETRRLAHSKDQQASFYIMGTAKVCWLKHREKRLNRKKCSSPINWFIRGKPVTVKVTSDLNCDKFSSNE